MEKQKGEVEDDEKKNTCLWMLPEGCVADILAFTTPLDVCRLSLVSTSLNSAADSDSVWAKFLPSDYRSVIAGSSTPIPEFPSLKELFVYLSHNHILIDQGLKSFSLDKWTGKKCYFLSARDLNITWGDTPEYWGWTSLPESRFPEVARLKIVWWLEIWGTIRAGILSPLTSYAAYFVYKLEEDFYGFDTRYMEVSVGISGVESEMQVAYLHPEPQYVPEDSYESPYTPPYPYQVFARMEDLGPWPAESDNFTFPKLRDDGWFELELGEYFTGNEDDCIELRMQDVKTGCATRGLIVEGIEIRPSCM
ncbi:F-box protein PP2-B11-like isoform X2 [Capsicum annuum]|uniref:F-box protein PP2-B11-like isoform X2 n=1 Tax=Capsicum annuum TaxID=4072 RepID=UPI001FB1466D|nr:F-box protein PP2-B11-like isoform X2 [Capsicum annuum]